MVNKTLLFRLRLLHAPPARHTWHCMDLIDIVKHLRHANGLLPIRIELVEHHHGRPPHRLLKLALCGQLPHLHFILWSDACLGANIKSHHLGGGFDHERLIFSC